MKCKILFHGKNKKNITNLSPAELAQRMVKVNLYQSMGKFRGQQIDIFLMVSRR